MYDKFIKVRYQNMSTIIPKKKKMRRIFGQENTHYNKKNQVTSPPSHSCEYRYSARSCLSTEMEYFGIDQFRHSVSGLLLIFFILVI